MDPRPDIEDPTTADTVIIEKPGYPKEVDPKPEAAEEPTVIQPRPVPMRVPYVM